MGNLSLSVLVVAMARLAGSDLKMVSWPRKDKDRRCGVP